MTAAANWDGNTVISPALDDLNFTAGLALAERTVNNNYAVNTQFRRLDFYDAGYTMTGTIMGLTNGIGTWHTAGNVAINASFNLLNSQSFTTNAAGTMAFGGQIYLNGQIYTYQQDLRYIVKQGDPQYHMICKFEGKFHFYGKVVKSDKKKGF